MKASVLYPRLTSAGSRARLIAVACCGLLCALALTGCGERELWKTDDPKEAIQVFVEASYFGRGDIAWHFLTPEMQKELTDRAARLNEEAGSELVKPDQLLTSGGFIGPHHIAKLEREGEKTADAATYRLKTHSDIEHTINLVRVEGIWRVDLGSWPSVEDARKAPASAPTTPTPPAAGSDAEPAGDAGEGGAIKDGDAKAGEPPPATPPAKKSDEGALEGEGH